METTKSTHRVARLLIAAAVLVFGMPANSLLSVVAGDGRSWTVHGEANGVGKDQQWRSVVYGNGMFVAVATNGTNRVMTSADGIAWTPRSVPAGQWMSVTYGGGVFVAVGGSSPNFAMSSADGITWTARTAPASGWFSVTHGNGRFVAVAGTATGQPWVMTSDNGIDWTARSLKDNDDQRWSAVTYGNGLFVAVGDVDRMLGATSTHRVMTSVDGVVWDAQTSAPISAWYSVTHGRGSDGRDRFVAVSYGDPDRVMTSENGTTWTVLADSASKTVASGAMYYAVAYGEGTFIAVAYGSKKIMTSADGLIWTASEPSTEANVWNAVAYGGNTFVAVGESGNSRVKRFGPNVPAKPSTSGLTCSNAITSLTVSLTSDGGSPVTNYEYHIATAHAEPTTWQAFSPAQTSSPLRWDMKALGFNPGVSYFYYVRAINAMGPSLSSWVAGSSSSCASNFTVSPPPAPTSATVVSSGSSDVTSDTTPSISVGGVLDGHTVTVVASKVGEADVTCSYVAPASSCDLGVLADGLWSVTSTQTDSRGLTSVSSAAYALTVDTVPPVVVSSVMNASGTQMTITFNEALGSVAPSVGDFVVSVDGVAVAVSSVTVVGSTLVVTFSSPVAVDGIVTLVYASPAVNAAQSNAAVQDRAGNDAAGFTVSAAVPRVQGAGGTGAGGGSDDSSSNDVPRTGGRPLPVRDVGGVLARLKPGVHQLLENGRLLDVELSVVDGRRLQLEGPGFKLVLSGDCSAGAECSILVDESGREKLVLQVDGAAQVSGFGFMPGSQVHVWIFSEPVYLGALTVGTDGTFSGLMKLVDVEVGEHTLQVNGISFDGKERTANLGVLVNASLLPATGVDMGTTLFFAVVAMLLGTLILLSRRRMTLVVRNERVLSSIAR